MAVVGWLDVLELVLVCCLAAAIYRSCVARRGLEAAAGTTAFYLFAVDTANVLSAPFADLQPLHAFIFMLLGPSMWHHRGTSWFAAGILGVTPWLCRTLRIALCSAAAWRCARTAARIGPLVPEHATLGWVAAPFYGAILLDGLETLLFTVGSGLSTY